MESEPEWLILVPTAMELEKLALPEREGICIELCGFGLVVSAANTARLIATYQPRRVLLCGIAGSLSSETELGRAYQFSRVGLTGIGVGSGDQHRSVQQMGWTQWRSKQIEISTEITLHTATVETENVRELIISCCAASANRMDADRNIAAFPRASAEEMEGFAVAAAAKIASIPCHIVRGISNMAGNRDHQSWKIDEALHNVSRIVNQIIGQFD